MSIIEKRYAEALINIASERNAIGDFTSEMEQLAVIYKGIADLAMLLENPEVKSEVKKNVIKTLFENQIRAELLNFLFILVDKGRIGYLGKIVDEFKHLADERGKILNLKIISAFPLADQQIDAIKNKYKTKYNAAEIKVQAEVDAGVVGGIKIVIGDHVQDATLKGRLNDLRKVLLIG